MELWVTEYQTPALGLTCKTTETLRMEQTPYQQLAVVNTEQYGRMLLLDGMVMTTDKDEFVYHEMISHVALNSHPHPHNVLIIGGGDGGVLREVVKNPAVAKATLVEIDERVIQASKDFFPQFCAAFEHPKAHVVVGDGLDYVKNNKNFDVIIVDSTEPVGPAVELFGQQFYQDAYAALNDDGMLVVQSESPFINQSIIKKVNTGINSVFPLVKLYLANVPTYPTGLWSFTVGSKVYDPEKPLLFPKDEYKYYTPAVHQAAFQLPQFVRDIIEQED